VTCPTVAGALDLLAELAAMTGAGKKAGRIVDGAKKALAQVRAANEGRPPVRTFCPIWRNPWMTVGPGTYMHDFITVCGGVNIFEWTSATRGRREGEKDPQVVCCRMSLTGSGPARFGDSRLRSISAARINYLLERHLCWYAPSRPVCATSPRSRGA
jgi:hypothetical protein